MTYRLPAFLAVAVLIGCSPLATPPPPAPQGVREIAVQQPVNGTGRDLVVDDPGLLGRALGVERSTVPEVLAADLRSLLVERGFRVVTAGAAGAPALRTEIRAWEPYSADYSRVTVDIAASLVDPTNGRELWTVQRANWHVLTPDARSGPEASTTAARDVARALLDGWQPGAAAPRGTEGR